MSPVKTEFTIFSQSEDDVSDDFIVDGVKLKYNKTPKMGDKIDEKLTTGPHIATIEKLIRNHPR